MWLVSEKDIYDRGDDGVFDYVDWTAIAAAMHRALPAHFSLGHRDIDLLHNWKAA